MNVLDIIQRAANAIGIPEPTVALAATDTGTVQLVELFNQAGRSLASRYGWQSLTREASFTTVATESQGALSTIIGANHTLRYIVNDTIWNRTQLLPVCGPLAPRTWQGYKALSLSGPYSQYRIRNDEILFTPVPAANESCYFEYVDKRWMTNAAATNWYQNANADTDLVLLDDELLLAELEWRWLRKKGLSYAEEKLSAEYMIADAMARDGTKPVLNLAGASNDFSPVVVAQRGSWNL